MMKKIFATPKRAAMAMGILFLVLAVIGIGTAFAAGSAVKSSSIGEDEARNFAFADAGVDPVLAKRVHSEFGHEQGHFVYEVEFIADNTEYEYWIKADDGSVVKKQMEILDTSGADITTAEDTKEESRAVSAPGTVDGQQGLQEVSGDEDTGTDGQSPYIGIDRAKNIALAHAGFSEDEISFSKAKLENDDGYTMYEVEFYKDRVEYEYKIDAVSGDIIEYDADRDD